MHTTPDVPMPSHAYGNDVTTIVVTEQQLKQRIQEMADKLSAHYASSDNDVILVGVLKGAVFFMTDLARAMNIPTQLEFMAVSSYGNRSSSSGVVRILKDLDRDIADRDVVIVEDIIDSGLTLSWLMKNLSNRQPKSLQVVSLLRKPEAVKAPIELFDLGFDMPNEFLVGYGLDFAERYRDLSFVGILDPAVYS